MTHDHLKLLREGVSRRAPQFKQKLDSSGLAVLHFGQVKTSSLSGKIICRSLSAICLYRAPGYLDQKTSKIRSPEPAKPDLKYPAQSRTYPYFRQVPTPNIVWQRYQAIRGLQGHPMPQIILNRRFVEPEPAGFFQLAPHPPFFRPSTAHHLPGHIR